MDTTQCTTVIKAPTAAKWKAVCLHAWIALIICVHVTLCVCTLHNGHNWGGDFSAYIMQAQSISEFNAGEFIAKNRVTVEASSSRMGPVAYPWGFPMMLAPVYATCGLHLFALKLVGVLMLAGLLIIMWYGFQEFHTPVWRSACVLLFALNPTLIAFNNNILSDIPFLCLSTLAICLLGKVIVNQDQIFSSTKDRVLVGLAIAAAFFTRTNGVLLLGVLCWSQAVIALINLWRSRREAQSWREAVRVCLAKDPEDPYKWLRPFLPYVSFIFMVLLWKLILPQGGSSHMAHLERVSKDSITGNALYYRDLLAQFFNGVPKYEQQSGSMIAYLVSLPFVLVGVIRHIKIAHHFLVYILLTLAMFIVWPHRQGLRFLFPVLPFYMMFFISGISLLAFGKRWWLKIPTTVVCLVPIACVLYFFSIRSVDQIERNIKNNDVIRHGPFADISTEMFAAVKEHTTEDDTIIFFKPRVMRLMTGRNTLRINNTQDMFVAQYICFLNKRQPFRMSQMQPLVDQQRARIVFRNEWYVLFQLDESK